MVEWSENGDRDLVRIEVAQGTARHWIEALVTVRAELFEWATAGARRGDVVTSDRLLRVYSALAHLCDVLRASTGDDDGKG